MPTLERFEGAGDSSRSPEWNELGDRSLPKAREGDPSRLSNGDDLGEPIGDRAGDRGGMAKAERYEDVESFSSKSVESFSAGGDATGVGCSDESPRLNEGDGSLSSCAVSTRVGESATEL